jgi:hypothetical protein
MEENKLLDLSKDELFKEIGKSLYTGVGILGFNDNSFIKLGKQWYRENIEAIKKHICTEEFKEKLRDENDKKSMLLLIADTLSSLSIQIPLFTLSVLLLKLNIEEVCSNSKNDDF